MLNKPRKTALIAVVNILILLLGCNQATQPGNLVNKQPDSMAIPTVSIATAKDTIFAGDGDTTIHINNGEAFLKGHIIANKARPKYTLHAQKLQTLTAVLRPLTKGGNVRINQLQRPNGSFDGPFGDSLRYTLKQSGNISFIIGENLMSGDPYTGDFILHILLSQR